MTPTPNLQAAAMRARAAIEAEDHGEPGCYQAMPKPFRDGYAEAGSHISAAILALPLEADHAAVLAEAKKPPEIAALIIAATRQRDNIERWIATGEPASSDESKSIYDGLNEALTALETP